MKPAEDPVDITKTIEEMQAATNAGLAPPTTSTIQEQIAAHFNQFLAQMNAGQIQMPVGVPGLPMMFGPMAAPMVAP